MEKSNKIYLIIILVCAALVIGLCVYAIVNHEKAYSTDAERFKYEYESLNGKIDGSNNKDFMEIKIDEENPIIYKTGKEIVDIMKNEEALIYFGFNTCPWCRNAVPVLLDAAKELNVSKIYYVDIFDIRDSYEFSGNIIPDQTKKGTDAYYEILDILDESLEEYFVKDTQGNMYDTGVKRLYAPTVVAISHGTVKGIHESTLESQTDPYTALSDEQKEELKEIYKGIINTLDSTTACKDDTAC